MLENIWLFILLAVGLANLPFVNQHLFIYIKLPNKPVFFYLLEMVVLYFSMLLIAYSIESNFGSLVQKGWQFYTITLCLFAICAFPGFVYRFFFKNIK